jgi:hypothetical protein
MISFKKVFKYFLPLLLLYILLLLCGYMFVLVINSKISLADIIILSTVFSLISLITIIIFLKGQAKEPESQPLYSIVAIGLKFLLEIVSALLWFIVAKKTSLQSVLIFFVLYLTLTLFTLWVILKTLKHKVL